MPSTVERSLFRYTIKNPYVLIYGVRPLVLKYTLIPRMNATNSMNELKMKGATIPERSATSPAIMGPGTRAMLDTDWETPNMPPCSFVGVFFEIMLGTAVNSIPTPKIIIVVNARKTIMSNTEAIRNKLIVINSDPKINIFASPLAPPDKNHHGGLELSFSQIAGVLYHLCREKIIDAQFFLHRQAEDLES